MFSWHNQRVTILHGCIDFPSLPSNYNILVFYTFHKYSLLFIRSCADHKKLLNKQNNTKIDWHMSFCHTLGMCDFMSTIKFVSKYEFYGHNLLLLIFNICLADVVKISDLIGGKVKLDNIDRFTCVCV